MNNRRRARIKALKRECRSEMRKCRGLAAAGIVWMRYEAKISYVAWGEDFINNAYVEFLHVRDNGAK